MTENSKKKKYVFEVHRYANKFTVTKAISEAFLVEVDSVNILNLLGKKKRHKGIVGRRANMKKAVVTLKLGHEINVLNEGVKL